MHRLREVSTVARPAHQVWWFLTHLDSPAYLSWHPRDHLGFHTLAPGDQLGLGRVMVFTERLGRRVFSFRCTITRSVDGRLVEFSAARPLNLLRLGRGAFRLEAVDDDTTRVEAVVELGWRMPVLGTVLDKAIAAAVDLAAVTVHMREEGGFLTDATAQLWHRQGTH